MSSGRAQRMLRTIKHIITYTVLIEKQPWPQPVKQILFGCWCRAKDDSSSTFELMYEVSSRIGNGERSTLMAVPLSTDIPVLERFVGKSLRVKWLLHNLTQQRKTDEDVIRVAEDVRVRVAKGKNFSASEQRPPNEGGTDRLG